jgi:hypothetical protein
MVFDQDTVYSFGRKPQYYRWTTPMEYMLYSSPKQPQLVPVDGGVKGPKPKRGLGSKPGRTIQTGWKQDVPVLVRAMVLAGETLFIAGPPDLIDEQKTLATFELPATQKLLARQAAVIEGSQGAVLRAVSKTDGKKIAERKLEAVPVFDGMIAAGNRIYYAATDGRIIALAGQP